MTFRDYHLHCTSATKDLFSIDFNLANALWFILKDLSHTVQLTANPLLNPFSNLHGILDLKLLEGIDMFFLNILTIKNYTQNLLVIISTRTALQHLFCIAQQISLEGFRELENSAEIQGRITFGLVQIWKLTYLFSKFTQNSPLWIH